MPHSPFKLCFIVIAYGDKFVATFLDFALPSTLAAGNIPAIAAEASVRYLIYSDDASKERIMQSPAFARLASLTEAEVISGMIVPGGTVASMNNAINHAIAGYHEAGYAFVLTTADEVFANGSLYHLFEHYRNGKQLVMTPALRSLDTSTTAMTRYYNAADCSLTITNREMVRLSLENMDLSSRCRFTDSNHFTNWPCIFYWKVGVTAVLGRFFHMHPLLFRLPRLQLLEKDTIDGGDFFSRLFPTMDQVHVVQDSDDIWFADLCEESANSWQLAAAANRADQDSIARWAKQWTFPLHRTMLHYNIRIHAAELAEPVWAQAEQAADTFCNGILKALDLKQPPQDQNRAVHLQKPATAASVHDSVRPIEQEAVAPKPLSVLLICLEFTTWQRAKSWTYPAQLGLEEGLESQGVTVTTIPALFETGCDDRANWLAHIREICAGQQFDQVWIELVHTKVDNKLLHWLTTVAPVRVAFLGESLRYPEEAYRYSPDLIGRREKVLERLSYMTHVLAADERDVAELNADGIKTLWWTQSVPERYVRTISSLPSHNAAAFYGTLYGTRQAWLQQEALQGLLFHPSPPENSTQLPALFDALHKDHLRSFSHGDITSERLESELRAYLQNIRTIRRTCFDLWLQGLGECGAVVNLPSFFQGYAGRVVEAMAAGTPVICWQVPERPLTQALFEDGKEILLFPDNDPEALARLIRILLHDNDLRRTVVDNARTKILRHHTTEKLVQGILSWIKTGTDCRFTEAKGKKEPQDMTHLVDRIDENGTQSRKRILLVNPPYRRFLNLSNNTFPLTFGSMATMVAQEGHQVAIYDADFDRSLLANAYSYEEMFSRQHLIREGLENTGHRVWQEIEQTIRDFRPDIVGITAMTPKFPMVERVAAIAKGIDPATTVVIGGHHPSIVGENVFADGAPFDVVVVGEGELTFLELVQTLGKPHGDLATVKGIIFRTADERIIRTPPRELIADLDTLPIPDRDLILNPGYVSDNNIISTRGCPFNCAYCGADVIWQHKHRQRSVANVMKEIRALISRSGSRSIAFWDDSFTCNKKRTEQLMTELQTIDGLTFSCITRLDLVDEEMLRWLKASGCVNILLGIESGDDRILQLMNKRINRSLIEEKTALIAAAGIPWLGFFIMGFPGETKETVLRTVEFMRKLKPAWAEINIFNPLPGTPIWTELEEKGLVAKDMDFSRYSQSSTSNFFLTDMGEGEFRRLAMAVAREFDAHNRGIPDTPAKISMINPQSKEQATMTKNCSPSTNGPAAGTTRHMPGQVHFLLNDTCNAKCVFCGGDYYRSNSGRQITLEKFKVMAANLHLERFEAIILAGAGDPLLSPHFVPILSYMKETYPAVAISVTTNGIALSTQLAPAFFANRVQLLNISINAGTRETYQRLMQVDEFDRVCRNAEQFTALARQNGSGPFLQFSIAISRHNIEELPGLVSLVHKLGGQLLNIFYCRFYPQEIRDLNIESPEYLLEEGDSLFFHQELSDRMVEEAKRLGQQLGVQILHEPLFREDTGPGRCVWPESELMVGFDGEIFPCGGGELHFKKKVASGAYHFGNVLQEPLEAFWNNETYRSLRLSRDGKSCAINECSECAPQKSHRDRSFHLLEWRDFDNRAGKEKAMDRKHVHAAPTEPLVSVIVPTHNRPEMLVHTLRSILSQSYRNFEIIVVNDAGADVEGVVTFLNEQKNITYIRQGKNRGLAAARNTGIAVARGKYIAYLDDDDIFYPDHLEVLVNLLENSAYKVAYTDANQAYQQLQHGQYVVTKREVTYSYDFDYELILKTNFVPVLCFMHEKACLEACGTFDESLHTHEDWDLWMRMSRKFRMQHIKKVTCEFSWREDSSKMTFRNIDDFRRTQQVVLQRGRQLLAEMQKKTNRSDDKVAAAYGKIKVLKENGSTPEAIAELKKLAKAVPDSAVVQNDLGVLLYQMGDKVAALSHYESAVRMAPGNALFQKNLADYYFVEAGKVQEAVDIYVELVKRDPTDIETLSNLGFICTSLGRPDEAAVFYNHVLKLDPSNEAARQALLTGKGGASSTTAATPEIEWYLRAQSLVQGGRQGEAILELEKLVAEYPDFATAHNDLAVLYYQNGEKEKVPAHYQRAVALDPVNINYRKNLADYYYVEEQRVDEAIEIYVHILQQHPDDLETLINLGQISSAIGRPQEARTFFAKALQRDPSNTVALQMLASLGNQAPELEVSPQHETGAASIIIVTYNSEKTIVPCLESVAGNLRSGDDVFIVDNCSKDDTVKTVETFITGKHNFTLISNRENVGFSAGTNIGIRQSSNPFIVMLNPDTVVTTDWLDHLIAHLQNQQVAAVGPVSRCVAGLQQMHLYRQSASNPQETIEETAAEFYRLNRGQAVASKLLIGFCLMVRREVLDRLGLLDEALFLGNDDLELSWRLRLNGYTLLVATDTFIHHIGQQSFMTESSATTSRLVQESTDALYAKLVAHYGKNHVPTPRELWFIDWFTPTASCFDPNARLLDLPTVEAADSASELVSMVILTFNQLHLTKQCVDSIARHTPQRHEVIFIDNGSTDGTVPWLQELVLSAPERYRLIDNGRNLGFAAGCNQGIQAATGNFILLLNNDVVVTEGWLEGMLQCLIRSSDIGIVGPMSNNISGLQKDHAATFTTIGQLDEYAARFRKRNRYRLIASRRIVGFCMLFRKELIDTIGPLDENFGSGNFEDDDLCLRAALAGFRNVIAGDVFIHHYGNQSFIGNGIDYGAAMDRNKKIFNRKWSNNLEETTARKLVALTALEKGMELAERGDFAAAGLLLLEKAIPFSPDNPAVFHTFAELLLEAKRFQDALEILQKSPAAEDDLRRMELKGYCTLGLGLLEKAVEFADQALAISPTSASALNLKGITLYALQQPSEARECFLKAIAADPSLGQPYTNLGVLAWEGGQPDEALELFERGAILAPTIADSITSYHAAITSRGAFEQAEVVLRDAKTLHPASRQIAFLLIDILIKQGKETTAMEEILSAISRFGIDDGLLDAALAVKAKVEEKAPEQKGKPFLSLCMIVRNEAMTLPRCLNSAMPLTDEIVVVDTGSTDRTRDIARLFDAQVYDYAWQGDFAAARNFALGKATGKWIIVLDADEVVAAKDAAAIRTLVQESRPAAYTFVTRNYITEINTEGWTANDGEYPDEEAAAGWVPSTKVRLFPNDNRIRFEKPVHEMVEYSLERAKIPVKNCPVPVHHYGKLDKSRERAKGEAYLQLGKDKIAGNGGDTQDIYELGVQAANLGKYREAIELFQRVLEKTPDEPMALFNMSSAQFRLGNYPDAMINAERALRLKPDLKEAACTYAMCRLYMGDVKKAIDAMEKVLKHAKGYPPAMATLAAAYCCGGNRKKASALIESLGKLNYNSADFLQDHADRLMECRRPELAGLIAAMITETSAPAGEMEGNKRRAART